MKRIFLFGIFCLMSVSILFAQQIERKTIQIMRPGGGVERTITVNAVFFAYGEQRITREGDFEVVHERGFRNGQWTTWELVRRAPPLLPTLRQHFDELSRDWSLFPNGTRILHSGGVQVFRLGVIFDRRSSPFWWSQDGRAIHTSFAWYMIVP